MTEAWKNSLGCGAGVSDAIKADCERMKAYLHQEIPLAREMAASVTNIQAGRVVLSAPLEPNLNHKATAFGGSISALAILSGWALLHRGIEVGSLNAELVIRANQIAYAKPIQGRFFAVAEAEPVLDWEAARRQLYLGRMVRAHVVADVIADGEKCAHFKGEYVLIPRER